MTCILPAPKLSLVAKMDSCDSHRYMPKMGPPSSYEGSQAQDSSVQLPSISHLFKIADSHRDPVSESQSSFPYSSHTNVTSSLPPLPNASNAHSQNTSPVQLRDRQQQTYEPRGSVLVPSASSSSASASAFPSSRHAQSLPSYSSDNAAFGPGKALPPPLPPPGTTSKHFRLGSAPEALSKCYSDHESQTSDSYLREPADSQVDEDEDASYLAENEISLDTLGPRIWVGTHFLPRYVRAEEVPGVGLFYIYDDGTRCPAEIDGERVNAYWGVTKAGRPRKRLAIACLTCREKKIKCNPDFPSCVQCEKFGRECVFKNAPRVATASSVGATNPTAKPGDFHRVVENRVQKNRRASASPNRTRYTPPGASEEMVQNVRGRQGLGSTQQNNYERRFPSLYAPYQEGEAPTTTSTTTTTTRYTDRRQDESPPPYKVYRQEETNSYDAERARPGVGQYEEVDRVAAHHPPPPRGQLGLYAMDSRRGYESAPSSYSSDRQDPVFADRR